LFTTNSIWWRCEVRTCFYTVLPTVKIIDMNKLKELLSKCKASVSITVNQHRDYYQSVEEHIEEQALIDEELIDEIGKEVYEEMKKTNTIVEIQAYPNTPVGSYRLFHYDIDKAIDIMLSCVNGG